MFLAAEEAVEPSRQRFLLYLYTPELPGLRARLLANGVEVSPIGYPEYMRSAEVRVKTRTATRS